MARTLAACALPALAVAVSWLRLEAPRSAGEALALVGLAVAAALPPRAWQRAAATLAAAAAALWIAFGVQVWELAPYRDERVLGPLVDGIRRGVEDFYVVLLPFEPERNPEMHALALAAVFGFTVAIALLVAGRRPVAAAAVTVVGAGWPATLVAGDAVGIGALALAAALSIPLVLRVRSAPSLVAGAAAAALVVVTAAWASSSASVARDAALDWEAWSIGGGTVEATGVRFAWDSNYDGIRFPPTETVVLTVDGPERAHYWRTATLDLFTDGHWFEDLFWLARVEGESDAMPVDRMAPPAASRRESWIEQRIEIKALVDDHLAAAGTPVALDSRQLGTVFLLSGGVLRVRDPLDRGRRYRVWSYVPDPSPAALARSRPRYPDAADRYLEVAGHVFAPFGSAGREQAARARFRDPDYSEFAQYRPLYEAAQRVAGGAPTPYAAVLDLEAWFRRRGGFVYDEQPPPAAGSPLVEFVTRTKAGYCQHYAGAMAVMLRMLGIPARVAVGFTSGTLEDGRWVVTDHDAHAWVEVWFAGQGWVPFDPTPGRGTFGVSYSFASDSAAVVNALDRGELTPRRLGDDYPTRRAGELADSLSDDGRGPSFAAIALLLATLWTMVVGGGKALVRRARYLTRDPRRLATASRRELEEFLRDQGIAVPASATLEELRRIVRTELGLDAHSFAAAAGRARFGPPTESRRDATAARTELRKLLRSVRAELSTWARFRGLVSVRSLVGR